MYACCRGKREILRLKKKERSLRLEGQRRGRNQTACKYLPELELRAMQCWGWRVVIAVCRA